MKTIIFYSYKGGTGRSLILANYARYLSLCKKSVFVLDCDLEAPGLHHKFVDLGYCDSKDCKLGLVDYLLFYQDVGQASDEIGNYVAPLSFPGNSSKCWFLPAGDAPSEKYSAKVLGIDWRGLFPEDQLAPGVGLLLHLKNLIERTYSPDFLLIDSRTGITDIGNAATKRIADVSVLLCLCNKENIAGTRQMLITLQSKVTQVSSARFPLILSRIPDCSADERVALSKVKRDLGDLFKPNAYAILHEEIALHVAEELRFGSDKALCESVLLRDYLNAFNLVDEETARQSPYFKLKKYLTNSVSNFPIRRAGDVQYNIEVVNNIKHRKKKVFRHAGNPTGGYDYIQGNNYKSFASAIVNSLVKGLQQQLGGATIVKKEIREGKINWDILGTQMKSHVFDFCSELYYLTKYRALFADVVQVGWIKTFTCFIEKDTRLYRQLVERRRESLPRWIQSLKRVTIGMMGESAATDEASRIISPILSEGSGNSLQFHPNAEALWEWFEEKRSPDKMIICDHSLAKKLHKLSGSNKRYAYAEHGKADERGLIFKFSKAVPAGFLFPVGDYEWRYMINKAIGDVIDRNQWHAVMENLAADGVRPFTWDELKRQIVLGKTPDDAYKWLRTIDNDFSYT